MPAVAAAKERAGRPVEDVAQEARVHEAVARRAHEVGLAPESVAPLFDELIDAARTIQHAYLALPPDQRPPVEAVDLARDLRPALSSLSDAIVALAADVASDHRALAGLDVRRVAERLDAPLPLAMRTRIVQALLRLRRPEHALRNERL
jgi:chorismate mutase-like protein